MFSGIQCSVAGRSRPHAGGARDGWSGLRRRAGSVRKLV